MKFNSKNLFSKDMMIIMFMGISSGLPLALTWGTLQAWMKSEGVDLGTIGLFAVVGLPYNFKFLWSPIFDRYIPLKFGRRKSWMLITQIFLVSAVFFLGLSQPKVNLYYVGIMAVLVSFFSASQDIVLDAWRREKLSDDQLGFGSSIFISAYLFSFRMISGAIALILADIIPWSQVYLIMAIIQSLGIIATFLCEEPQVQIVLPKTLKEAVVEPFKDYFAKPNAWWILLFILLYKIGDNMSLQMTTPYYLELGFTKTEIGATTKAVGWIALAIGGLLAGAMMKKIKIASALLYFGIFQVIAVYSFSVLTFFEKSISLLAAIITLDNFAIGMSTTAYVTYMASITNKKFTATQYALLTSLMGVPRTIASAPTGYMAQALGWHNFFLVCALLGIPGLLLIPKLRKIA